MSAVVSVARTGPLRRLWLAATASGRRRRGLALAVRLFECGGEGDVSRAVLSLSAASMFERYLAGELGSVRVLTAPPQPAEEEEPAQSDHVVPFPGRPGPPIGLRPELPEGA